MSSLTDADAVSSVALEISEINHRVTVLGNLLFAQQTDQITSLMDPIRQAIGSVQTAVQDIQNITTFVTTVTTMLTLVDKVIDTAKMFMV